MTLDVIRAGVGLGLGLRLAYCKRMSVGVLAFSYNIILLNAAVVHAHAPYNSQNARGLVKLGHYLNYQLPLNSFPTMNQINLKTCKDSCSYTMTWKMTKKPR